MPATMIHADVLAWAATYTGSKYHALLCDCPYEMAFMGRAWDASGVAFDPNTWVALAEHLHPGAYLFVAAGTLNDDLISVAMRNAGLRKHHKCLLWGYGSGFPKATNLSKAIDKRAGAERQVIGRAPKMCGMAATFGGGEYRDHALDITAPATDLARQWAGHRYGQQSLKPAAETILIFQKPYAGQPIDAITATGAGALNIAQARIGSEKMINAPAANTPGGSAYHMSVRGMPQDVAGTVAIGRWPANLLLTHDPRCNGACVADCAVAALGRQSGESRSMPRTPSPMHHTGGVTTFQRGSETSSHADSGTAARYFHQSDWMLERLELQDSLIYSPKAARAEREAGLDPLQTALMRQLYGVEDDSDDFNIPLSDGEEISGGGGHSHDYQTAYQAKKTSRYNTHPTLKPLSLCRHLATLLLPPDAYAPRRLLVPFAGAASEMVGALLAGWEEIDGVELDETHCRIGRARLAYWQQQRHRFDQGQPITIKSAPTTNQPTLFDE